MVSHTLNWISPDAYILPKGWRAGATYVGIKTYGAEPRFDLGLLASDVPCSVAGVYTQSAICGAPVALCKQRTANGIAQAIVVNSGCSNVAMGALGARHAETMTQVAADKLAISPEDVLVASTGVIGRPLPMDKIAPAIPEIVLSKKDCLTFARAMMTTDTVPKYRALRLHVSGHTYTVCGVAKGSGMVHPNMATVLCFMMTDAPATPEWLRKTLPEVANVSLNMLDVDMDTSTSDTMLLFANGMAGGDPIDNTSPVAQDLHRAFEMVAIHLTQDLARDGEGARTLIEVNVDNAKTIKDARMVARTVVSSPLVKTMVTGRDPNPGRILMAVGRTDACIDIAKLDVWIGQHCVFRQGTPPNLDYKTISQEMDSPEVVIRIDLGVGSYRATAWGCDLTEDYIRINADYTT